MPRCLLAFRPAFAALTLAAALASLGALLPAAEPPSLEDRLRALEAKVEALQRENAELRRAVAPPTASTAPSAPPAPATSASTSTSSSVSGSRPGLTSAASSAPVAPTPADHPPVPLAPSGHETKLIIGGFTQVQGEFGGTGDPRFAGGGDRIFVRRSRLYVAGSFAEHFDFKIEGEFGANSVTPTSGLRAQANEILLGWSPLPQFTLRAGQLKPAYAAELLAIEYKGPMIERSLGAERIADGRQVGAGVAGEVLDGRAGYYAFLGNGTGANSSANDNRKFLQTARAYVVPVDSPAAGRLLLGADALHSADTALAKPGFGFDLAPGGAADNLFTGRRDGWGLDAAWHAGRFDVSTEWLRTRFSPANRLPARAFDAESWQLTAACFLVPGRLQAAARREHFDPDLSRPGDATNNWMVGLDYYFKGDDIRFVVDYLFGHPAGLPGDHGRLLTRFQIVY